MYCRMKKVWVERCIVESVEDLACSHGANKPSLSLNIEYEASLSSPNTVDREALTLEQAFCSFDQRADTLSLDDFICISQKCRKRRDLGKAFHLLEVICSNGLEAHKSLGNHLVPMFVECGSISRAQEVFDRLIHRNVHTWTSLISGYAQCGLSQHARNLYKRMQESCVSPNSYTLVALLKACLNLREVQETHLEIADKGYERDVFVGSTLV
eukprot:c11597_g1_i1 orf=2-634(-)